MLCGSATTFGALVAFRIVQGLGAGALQPVAMTISADIYTLEERARIQGIFTGAWGAANVLGPVIGGWIVVHASWPWVFWVNVPVGALSVLLLLVSYRDPARDVAASLRALATPFPTEVLRPPAVPAGLVASLFAGGILAACSAYVPLWMTLRSNGDALAAGAALVPLLVGWAIGSSFGVRVLVTRGMRTSVGGGFGDRSARRGRARSGRRPGAADLVRARVAGRAGSRARSGGEHVAGGTAELRLLATPGCGDERHLCDPHARWLGRRRRARIARRYSRGFGARALRRRRSARARGRVRRRVDGSSGSECARRGQ